jgi:thiamine-phosphate diphosphorylase
MATIRRVIHSKIDFVQVREKDLSDREAFSLLSRVLGLSRGANCKVLLNGRADIALAAGAHGVHLPSQGLQVRDIKPWVPSGFIIGVSVHSLREAGAAVRQGAHYLLLGPIYPTESKLGYGNPLGIKYFRRACSRLRIPVFGLGGIGPELIQPVLRAGAAGVAGIGLYQKHFREWKTIRDSM